MFIMFPFLAWAQFPVTDNGAGATGVTVTDATLNGNLTGGLPSPSNHVVIYWCLWDGDTNAWTWANTNDFGLLFVGPLATNLFGLMPNTQYFYRCWASNLLGEAWAPETTNFTTMIAGPPYPLIVPANDGALQPGGPTYPFCASKYEIRNDEFVAFLNDAEMNPGNERGTNMFINAGGTVYFSNAMSPSEQMFVTGQSRLTYNNLNAPGMRYSAPPQYAGHPVVGVTWFGAVKYCNWLTIAQGLPASERCYGEGSVWSAWKPVTAAAWPSFSPADRAAWLPYKGYRLAMDDCTNAASAFNEFYLLAAWDGAIDRTYGFGRDAIGFQDANYDAETWPDGTTPCGYYDGIGLTTNGLAPTADTSNQFGLYDLSGNAAEWVNDRITDGDSTSGTVRGGSFATPSTSLLASFRTSQIVQIGSPEIGFRVVTTFGGGTPAEPGRLSVSGIPAYVFTNQPIYNMKVEAWKGTNLWTDYTGTVHISSIDATAFLPSDYTFTPGDGGIHFFASPVIFSTPGEHFDVKANDTVDFAINGDQHDIVVFNGYGTILDRFVMTGFMDPVTTGQWTSVSIGAADMNFNLVTNYLGEVIFSSSDGAASLPNSGVFLFSAGDAGWRTFTNDLQFNTIGEHWLRIEDNIQTTAWAEAWNITVQGEGFSTNVTHFVVDGPHWTPVDTWCDLYVSARNQYERDVTNFTGVVEFYCSDPSATFPATYTFTAGDEGRHAFSNVNSVQFKTPGDNQWIEARWQVDTNILGGLYGIHVDSGMGPGYFEIETLSIALAGNPTPITIKAMRGNGQVDTNYTGTIAISCSDPGASYPNSHVFGAGEQGVFSASVTFGNGGLQKVNCEDQVDPSRSASEGVEVLVGGATNTTHFRVEMRRPVGIVGFSNDVFVAALGDGEQINLTHTGNVDFTSPNGPASFAVTPFNGFVNGVAYMSNQVCFLASGDQVLDVALSADTNICGQASMFVAGGGTLRYVDVNAGLDANDGLTPASAWQTLNYAGVSSFAGDVVIVAPGKYHENVVVQETGAAGNWLTFYADDDGRFFGKTGGVNVDPGSGTGFQISVKDYIVLCGFEIYPPAPSTGIGIVATGASHVRLYGNEIGNLDVGIYVDGSSDPVIQGNSVDKCGIYGIQVNNSSDNMRMERNFIGSCGRGIELYVPSLNISITDNHVEGCPNGGIHLSGWVAMLQFNEVCSNAAFGLKLDGSSYADIRNNLLLDNAGPGIFFDTATPGMSKVINNTIVRNGDGLCVTNTDGIQIRNNIVAFNTAGGITADGVSTNTWAYDYNCVYGNSVNYGDAAAAGLHDISADPLFGGGKDFHLKSRGGRMTPNGWTVDGIHSPCIDAGDPVDNWNQEPVPNGGRINMGRYGGTKEASRSAPWDGDGDGMPDAWEIQYFGSTNALPDADADLDIMPNLHEYVAGTDPTNGLSLLAFSASGITNGNPWVGWPSVAGRIYGVEFSTNGLAPWFSITTNQTATPPFNSYENMAPHGTSRFYRVLAKFDSTNQAVCVGLDAVHWFAISSGPGGSANTTNAWFFNGQMPAFTAAASNGYYFTNWTGTITSTNNPITLVATQCVSEVAHFAINTYNITATNGPGGTITPLGTVWVDYGANTNFVITSNVNYHVTNVVVDGIFGGPTNDYTFANVTNGGHTITALFGIDQYTLSVTSPLLSATPPAGAASYPYGTPLDCSVVSPLLLGPGTQYMCTGWTGSGSVPLSGPGTNVSITVTNASSLAWNGVTQFLLTAVSADANGGVTATNGWYDAGTPGVTLTATGSNGYYFANWSGTLSSTNNPLVLTLDQAYTLTAHFATNSYVINATAGLHGTITSNGAVPVVHGANQSFTITPNVNYHITNVTVDGGSIALTNSYTFLNVTNNGHSIDALFGIDDFTLTVVSLWGTPTPSGITTNPWNTLINASVAGSPVANGMTQYVCTGWSGTGSVPPSGVALNTSFNITNDSTLTWNWQTQYRLAPAAGANGNVDVVGSWHNAGSNVTITATANGGYHFAGWTGDVPGPQTNDSPLTLAMTQARTITANFALDLGSVTVTISPAGAAAAGAQWRMTTGPDTGWHNSGDVIPNVNALGNPYTVTFGAAAGWTTPANITTVTVTNGAVTARTGTYLMGTMALIPGGTFQMGILNGAGGHSVTLSDFYLDVHEVTVAEYQAFCLGTGSTMPAAPAWNPGWAVTTRPMVNLTWNEAAAYAAWAGKRLPTEAEFEYAMRCGAPNNLYPWGNTIGSGNANYGNNVGLPTVSGTYAANAYGLFDIAGNVWEWCSDWYQSDLAGPVADPTGPGGGSAKIIRGGSYINSSLRLRCAPRYSLEPFARYVDLGFRCASAVGTGGAAVEPAPKGMSNLNGTPAWWAEWYFGVASAFDSTLDSDGDGLNNGQEYIAGTDPTQSGSVLAIEAVQPAPAGNGFVITWSSVAGKFYTIERASDITKGFTAIATDIQATPPQNTYVDTTGTGGLYFYRVTVK